MADFGYAAWCKFLFWCRPLWFITVVTSSPETLHSHRQWWSLYRGRFTLANHTSYTPLFECIILWFIWHCTTRTVYSSIPTSHLDAMTESLPMLRYATCIGETSVGGGGCESVSFRLDLTRSLRTARLYVDSQYISLTLLDIDYLVDLVLCNSNCAITSWHMLPYVTATLTSVTCWSCTWC